MTTVSKAANLRNVYKGRVKAVRYKPAIKKICSHNLMTTKGTCSQEGRMMEAAKTLILIVCNARRKGTSHEIAMPTYHLYIHKGIWGD